MDQRNLGLNAMGAQSPHPFDVNPSAAQWAKLTMMPEKVEAFAVDIYFRECWADAVSVFGDRTADIMAPLGLLTFKPDAIVGRRMRDTVDYLSEQGFEIAALAHVEFSRLGSRELWRYNWNFATLDRIHLSTLSYGATDTLLMIVRDLRYDGAVPGAVRLSALKGSAAAEKRAPHHLRARLRAPHRLINFVHVADEPADVIRESAILLDQKGRLDLLQALTVPGQRLNETLDAVSALEARYPPHDLDFDQALARRVAAAGLGAAAVQALIDAAHHQRKLRWDQLVSMLPPATDALALWDFICIGCWTLADERDGHPDLLPSVSPADWEKANRSMPPPLSAASG